MNESFVINMSSFFFWLAEFDLQFFMSIFNLILDTGREGANLPLPLASFHCQIFFPNIVEHFISFSLTLSFNLLTNNP